MSENLIHFSFLAGVGGFDFNGAISSLECLKCSLVSGAQVGSDGMK